MAQQQSIGKLDKTQSGINGFDDITYGGLPQGRPTIVCGGAGSGKTLFAMEFLVKGATDYDQPGVFISFEEGEADLVNNFLSLGFDLEKLQSEGKILLDYVHVERSEIEETGEYSLDGLFLRMDHAISSIGAKRVVLDTRSRRCFPVSATIPFYEGRSGAYSAGSRIGGSQR